MKSKYLKDDYVLVEPSFPHDMLLRVNKLTKRKRRLLQDQDTFLKKYEETYKDCGHDLFVLKYGYKKNVVRNFFENDKGELWRKRVFIKKILRSLIDVMSEKDAVILLETLMYMFRWDFSVRIQRVWEMPEDKRANFRDASAVTEEKKDMNEAFAKLEKELEETETEEAAVEEEPVEESPRSVSKKIRKAAAPSREKTRRRPKRYYYEDDEYDDYYDEEEPPRRRRKRSVLDQEPESVLFYKLMTPRYRRVLRNALNGNVVNQCDMGDFYADVNSDHLDYKEAIRWYEVSAEQGFERAYYEMGKIYDMDKPDLPKGKEEAIRIYTKLAKQGFPTAQCILGMKYWLGDGVEENRVEAAAWLKKAALQYHTTAIRNLADLYNSAGNAVSAMKWYRIGAAQGDEYCRIKVEKWRD